MTAEASEPTVIYDAQSMLCQKELKPSTWLSSGTLGHTSSLWVDRPSILPRATAPICYGRSWLWQIINVLYDLENCLLVCRGPVSSRLWQHAAHTFWVITRERQRVRAVSCLLPQYPGWYAAASCALRAATFPPGLPTYAGGRLQCSCIRPQPDLVTRTPLSLAKVSLHSGCPCIGVQQRTARKEPVPGYVFLEPRCHCI